MQIFMLDPDPGVSAKWYCDKHIVKIPVEAAQIACEVVRQHKPDDTNFYSDFPRRNKDGSPNPYRPSHKHHPLVKWAGSCQQAFAIVIERGLALCAEYTRRYGRTHASQAVLEWAGKHIHMFAQNADNALSRFPLPLDTNLHAADVFATHRNLYKHKLGTVSMAWRLPGQRPTWL